MSRRGSGRSPGAVAARAALLVGPLLLLLASAPAAGAADPAAAMLAKSLKPLLQGGVYQLAITVDTSTGGVNSRATSVACTDAKSGARVVC